VKSPQITKKDNARANYHRETGHWEGKYWCNCLTRGWRKWRAKKLGYQEEKSPTE